MTKQDLSHLVPEGWEMLPRRQTFIQTTGPFYIHQSQAMLGFITEERHMNSNNVCHGGMLATLADTGMFFVAKGDAKVSSGATISLNLNYLAPAPLHRFIYSKGRIVRDGKSISFVEGSLFDGDTELMTFHGTIKKFRPKK